MSLKFNILSFVFPLFIVNLLNVNLLNSTIFEKNNFFNYINCDETIKDVLAKVKTYYTRGYNKDGLKLFTEAIEDKVKNNSEVLKLKLTPSEAQVFTAFCHVPYFKSLAFNVWEGNHILMCRDRYEWDKKIHGNPLHRIEVCGFNSIFRHTEKNVSLFTLIKRIELEEEDFIELKESSAPECDNTIFVQMLKHGLTKDYEQVGDQYINRVTKSELVFLGNMPTTDLRYFNYGPLGINADYLSRLYIYERFDLIGTDEMRYDFGDIHKRKNLDFLCTKQQNKWIRYNWADDNKELPIGIKRNQGHFPLGILAPNLKKDAPNEVYYYLQGKIPYPFSRLDYKDSEGPHPTPEALDYYDRTSKNIRLPLIKKK